MQPQKIKWIKIINCISENTDCNRENEKNQRKNIRNTQIDLITYPEMFMFVSILLFIVYKSFCIQCTLYILFSNMNYRQGEKVKFDITGTIDRERRSNSTSRVRLCDLLASLALIVRASIRKSNILWIIVFPKKISNKRSYD